MLPWGAVSRRGQCLVSRPSRKQGYFTVETIMPDDRGRKGACETRRRQAMLMSSKISRINCVRV
jgi:hypothetical protein